MQGRIVGPTSSERSTWEKLLLGCEVESHISPRNESASHSRAAHPTGDHHPPGCPCGPPNLERSLPPILRALRVVFERFIGPRVDILVVGPDRRPVRSTDVDSRSALKEINSFPVATKSPI